MQVEKIFLHPFKSLRGFNVQECEINEHGFLHDRIYMLVIQNSSGEWTALTQRREPAMSRIATSLENDKLALSYKDKKVYLPLDITEFPNTLPTIDMELWGFPMTCKNIIYAVPEVHRFFSEFFTDVESGIAKRIADDIVDGVAPNLGIVISSNRRVVPQNEISRPVTSSFQDIYPGSLMTTASYEDLVRHVAVMNEEASIDMDSFRMNMLVSTDEPWIEDDWKEIRIGDQEWVVVEPAKRCSMPAVDQKTGTTRKGRHPLPSLEKFRVLEKGQTPSFGLNLFPKTFGFKVRVGDKVQILKSE